MTLTIKFIGAFRHISGKTHSSLQFKKGTTVQDVVNQLGQQIPELKGTFCYADLNEPHSNSLILVNNKEISILNGYETKLNDGDEVVFVPVVHGG
ncbi:MAG: MoaD/ThiS family protein [Betaproteobacteria bacterium]|jgi:MoaD family protein